MSDDMDKTASRKPVVQVHVPQQPARSEEPKQQVRTGQRPKRKTRPGHTSGQRRTRAERQGTSQSNSSSRNRTRADAPRRNRSARAQHAAPKRRSRRGVPVVVLLVAVLLSVVCSVLVTRSILIGQVREAQSEAAAAQNRAKSLADQLEGQSAKDTTKGADAAAGADATKDKATVSQSGLESPWISDGKFSTGDATLDEEVKTYCDGVVDKSQDVDTAALELFKSIAWSEYVERDSAQSPSGKDWRTKFARMYYENDCSGNCYEFSTFLSYCLRYLGFSDAKAEGVLVELQSGGWGDHCIVYVTNKDGSSCICDTARGTNGWMIPSTSYNVKMQDLENA